MFIAFLLCYCLEIDNFLSQKALQSDHFITKEIATKTASNLIFNKNPKALKFQQSNALKKRVKSVFPVSDKDSQTVFYIINYQGDGFVILSADNRMLPILAYSSENDFPTDSKSYPGRLVDWLCTTRDGIKTIRKSSIIQIEEAKKEWERVLASSENIKPLPPPLSTYHKRIGHFLHTDWVQGCGFNKYLQNMSCTGECGKVFVGSMPFWLWPKLWNTGNIRYILIGPICPIRSLLMKLRT